MDNMTIYNKHRTVPQNATKTIGAGRLKGMTDINPMWRIQCLTEDFGACGVGWYAEILRSWTEQGADGVVCAFVDVALRIKQDGEWSMPIVGTGGSSLVAKEKNGLYTSDEAFKMAYTDAISVCCKMLGYGADTYWQKDRTKYNTKMPKETNPLPPADAADDNPLDAALCEVCGTPLTPARVTLSQRKHNGHSFCPSCEIKEG